MPSWPQSWCLNHACYVLNRGGVIAYPTEAVWGVGCDPWNEDAVIHLCQIKQRPLNKGLIVVASNKQQLEPFIKPLSREENKALDANWPGAVTWLVPARLEVPAVVTGGADVIAVRVSNHPVVKSLCDAFGGAIISSSANPSGRAPAKTALHVRRYFRSQLDFLVNGALGGLEKPTQIIDLKTGRVHR